MDKNKPTQKKLPNFQLLKASFSSVFKEINYS